MQPVVLYVHRFFHDALLAESFPSPVCYHGNISVEDHYRLTLKYLIVKRVKYGDDYKMTRNDKEFYE